MYHTFLNFTQITLFEELLYPFIWLDIYFKIYLLSEFVCNCICKSNNNFFINNITKLSSHIYIILITIHCFINPIRVSEF